MLNLPLSSTLRDLMLEELAADLEHDRPYISPRLSVEGRVLYPGLLRESFATGDSGTLADAIRSLRLLKRLELSQRNGRPYEKAVPANAPETLADGEFGRFYARGACLLALTREGYVEVFRAREVIEPRVKSLQLEGRGMDARRLLADLRKNVGVDTHLGVPAGPNSGLNVRLPVQK